MRTRVLCLVVLVSLLVYAAWESFGRNVEKGSHGDVVDVKELVTDTSSPQRDVAVVINNNVTVTKGDENKLLPQRVDDFINVDPPGWDTIVIPPDPGGATISIGPITSGGKQLKAELKYNTATCTGHVVIFTPDCKDEHALVSQDERWNRFLNTVRGPNWYRVNIEGDDVTFMVPLEYAGGCKYVGLIPKVKSTNLRVTIKWETDNHLGVTEMVQTVNSFREKYLTRATMFGDCNIEEEEYKDKYYHKKRTGFENANNRYQWAHPIKGIEWVWGNGLTSTTSCNDKVVIFIGDSQLRSTWRHWEGILKRKQPELAKMFKSDEVYLRGHRVAYFFDPFMERLFGSNVTSILDEEAARDVVIVFGFGAWGANIIPGWTHQMFVSRVTSIFQQIANNKRSNVRYIWLGTPTWPKPRRNSNGFRITNARLSLWNRIGNKLARAAGVPTVDFFAISYPFIKMNRDEIHYDNSVVAYSVVEQISNLFCNPTLT